MDFIPFKSQSSFFLLSTFYGTHFPKIEGGKQFFNFEALELFKIVGV